MRYLYGRFSENEYIVYDTSIQKFEYLRSEVEPSLKGYRTLILRCKLTDKQCLLNKNDFAMEYFDENTFTTKIVAVIGIDSSILTGNFRASLMPLFSKDGKLIDRVEYGKISITGMCISPYVEVLNTGSIIQSSGSLMTSFCRLEELWIPSTVGKINSSAIISQSVNKIVICGNNVDVNLVKLRSQNTGLRELVISEQEYIHLGKDAVRGVEDVLCIRKIE